MPDNNRFRNQTVMLDTMRRVLSVYALHNPEVGYCQGMNVVLAMLLLVVEEEDAFFTLDTIVHEIMPGYYAPGLPGLIHDQRVLQKLMEKRHRDLCDHLDALGVPFPVVTTRWFMCLFVGALPTETVLRLWDCILLEGKLCLFRATVSLFETAKEVLLECTDADQLFENIRTLPCRMFGASEFLDNLFDEEGEDSLALWVTEASIQEATRDLKKEDAAGEESNPVKETTEESESKDRGGGGGRHVGFSVGGVCWGGEGGVCGVVALWKDGVKRGKSKP